MREHSHSGHEPTAVSTPVPAAAAPESVHARLRRATAEQHRVLDHRLAYLLTDRLSPGRYAALLSAFFGFYGPLEDDLARWQAAAPSAELPLVRRTCLLARDLLALGADTGRIPMCTSPPVLPTLDHAAGALYVLEGACLGGQVIARAVRKSLGIGPANGASFFAGAGAATGARWRHVLTWLDDRDRCAAGRDAIVAGARDTFSALAHWLATREVLDE